MSKELILTTGRFPLRRMGTMRLLNLGWSPQRLKNNIPPYSLLSPPVFSTVKPSLKEKHYSPIPSSSSWGDNAKLRNHEPDHQNWSNFWPEHGLAIFCFKSNLIQEKMYFCLKAKGFLRFFLLIYHIAIFQRKMFFKSRKWRKCFIETLSEV